MTNQNYFPPPTQAIHQPASPPKPGTPRGLWTGLAGAVLVIIGAFLPWVSVASVFGNLGVNGIDGDGKITAGLAALGGLLLWLGWTNRSRVSVIVTIVAAALAGLVTLYDWSNVSDKVSDLNNGDAVRASIGIGLYATGIGIVMLFASAFDMCSDVDASR